MAVPPDKFAIYRQILERAWEDKNFKARLIADPKEVLEEYGISYKEADVIRVIEEESPHDKIFCLPKSEKDFIC